MQQDLLHKLNKRRIHAGFVYIFNHMMTDDRKQNDVELRPYKKLYMCNNHKNNNKYVQANRIITNCKKCKNRINYYELYELFPFMSK